MNQGSYYLYEYEHCKRCRNVGFLQIFSYYPSYILTLHVRSLPVSSGDQLEVHAFFLKNHTLTGAPVALLNCSGQNLSTRLTISQERFPHNYTLKHIDGFLLFSNTQNSSLLWIASSVPLPDEFTFSDLSVHVKQPSPEVDSELPDTDTINRSTSTKNSVIVASELMESNPSFHEDPDPSDLSGSSIPRIKKISRQQLSTLPRKFWFLSNNSFLLHGYYNYNHLLLVEDDGHLWLGVPGIYDPREAHVANLFGFPQFTASYVSLLELSVNECENSDTFGHWCRCLK